MILCVGIVTTLISVGILDSVHERLISTLSLILLCLFHQDVSNMCSGIGQPHLEESVVSHNHPGA